MTDQRHDDHGPSRPQVIDLDAEEIRTEPESPAPDADESRQKTESAADSEPPPAPAAQAQHGRSPWVWIAAALVLAAVGGAWLHRSLSGEMTAMKARLDAIELNDSAFSDQLAGLRQAAAGASEAAGSAEEQARNATREAAAAVTGIGGLDGRIGALDQRIAAAEKTAGAAAKDLDALRKSITAGASPSGSGTAIDTAALAALGQRIDALEKDVASLKSSAAQAGGADKASVTSALSQALSDLKAKIAAGTAYAEEYERIARIVPAAAGLEAVGARAAEGLPTAQGLAEELRAAIPSLPQPAAPPAEDDSYFGILMKSLSGIVTIREIGEADWPGVAERAAAFAEAGDLNQAIGVVDGAEGEKPMALTRWRERAAARLQLEAALSQVSEAVLRQIAAMGGAQQ